MARFFKKQNERKGIAPGTLVFIGERQTDDVLIRLIDYNGNQLTEEKLEELVHSPGFFDQGTVTWLNFDGLHDLDIIRKVGEVFSLHPLLTEDVVNTGQRPKLVDFDNCLYMVMKMLMYHEEDNLVRSEQLSLVIGPTYVITFQESIGDVFEPVRERIRKQKGRIRGAGPDYLAYTLLDTVIDNYQYVVERMGEQIEDLEDDVLTAPTNEALARINDFKREMNYLRKIVRPVREALLQLTRTESELIDESNLQFNKDLADLISQVSEAIDTYRDMLSDLLNIYHTSVSNKLNDIMKVLTIFSAIFIPLTFIAGVYGTNFDVLPELHFKYSYFIMWLFFLIVISVMLMFFKRRKWL